MSSISASREMDGARRRDAERACAQITRRAAKNFYLGFLALPREKRIAIYALYSFARQVDDEVDDAPNREAAEAGIARQRERLRGALAGDLADPVMWVLMDTVERFHIPVAELEEVIDGVEMDLHTTRYETWDELTGYCRRVAGAVGRMCTRIFGSDDETALRHADNLGLALQLTNILRDVREDASMGRVYLPRDELLRHQITEAELLGERPGAGWEPFVAYEVKRARELYEDGRQLCAYVPHASAACLSTMAGIYERILDRIALDPRAALHARVSLSTPHKLGIAARSWVRR
ncbi:MAG: presqualene diphosphate synthase HpnD [Candidatus Dormiibacterota bacterium]